MGKRRGGNGWTHGIGSRRSSARFYAQLNHINGGFDAVVPKIPPGLGRWQYPWGIAGAATDEPMIFEADGVVQDSRPS